MGAFKKLLIQHAEAGLTLPPHPKAYILMRSNVPIGAYYNEQTADYERHIAQLGDEMQDEWHEYSIHEVPMERATIDDLLQRSN